MQSKFDCLCNSEWVHFKTVLFPDWNLYVTFTYQCYSRLFLILLEIWQSDTYIYILLFMSTIPKFKYENKDLNAWSVFLRSGQRCWVLLLTNNSQKTSWLTSKTTLVPLTTFKAYRYWVPFSFLVNWMHFLPPTDSILIPLIMEEENKIMNENMALNITFD